MLQNGELNYILNIHKMHRQLEVQIHYMKLPVCIFSCLKMEHFDVDNNLTSLKLFSMIGTLETKILDCYALKSIFVEWHTYLPLYGPLGAWRRRVMSVNFFSFWQMTDLQILTYTKRHSKSERIRYHPKKDACKDFTVKFGLQVMKKRCPEKSYHRYKLKGKRWIN